MVSCTLLATGLALLVVTSAAPSLGQTFSVPQVAVNLGYKTSGTQKLAQLYRKYHMQMPSALVAACAKQTGHVAADPTKYDSEYLEKVTVGDQQLVMNFDTGSSDLWVLSNSTPAAQRQGHPYYTPDASAKRLRGYTWDITYGDGAMAKGIVYRDKVNVGGAIVTSQAVEAATSVTADLTAEPYDGILGLAFSGANTVEPKPQLTFFDSVKPTLKKPLFTADLRVHAGGAYDFGYIDSSRYTGNIHYVKVDASDNDWAFPVDGYAIGSKPFVARAFKPIADTGSSLAMLPDGIVRKYYENVQGAYNSEQYGGYVFPCSAKLPSFGIGIGGYRAVIPGKYINYSPAATGSSDCFGGIQSDGGQDVSILGDVFLKSQFVVFENASTPLIGFAAKPT